jgi:hypothetical protein
VIKEFISLALQISKLKLNGEFLFYLQPLPIFLSTALTNIFIYSPYQYFHTSFIPFIILHQFFLYAEVKEQYDASCIFINCATPLQLILVFACLENSKLGLFSTHINKSPPFDTVPAPSDRNPFSHTLLSGSLHQKKTVHSTFIQEFFCPLLSSLVSRYLLLGSNV